MNLQMVAIITGTAAMVTAALWMNSFRRGTLLFGLHTDAAWADSPAGRRAVLVYRVQLLLWLALTAAVALTGAYAVAAAVLPVLSIGTVVAARRQASRHPSDVLPVRTASLLPDKEAPPGGWMAGVAPFAVLGVAAWWLNARWPQIPERFAVHWDINGNANRWAGKSVAGVYGPLMFGAAMVLMLTAITWGMLLSAPRAGSGAMRRACLRLTAAVTWMIALISSAISLNEVGIVRLPIIGITLALLAVVAAFSWPLLRAYQGSAGDPTPDNAWKMGLFYYNPADPSLMVEKRFGMGYTLNMAHGAAWAILCACLAAPVAAMILFFKH